MSTGSWTHLAMSFLGGAANSTARVRIHVNGSTVEIAAGAGTLTSYVPASANNLQLMDNPGTTARYVNAEAEDFRVFGRSLSDNEIKSLAAGYRGPLGGEVGWWTLDTARGLTNWDGASLTTHQIPDYSSNSNVGTPISTLIGRASDAPRMGTLISE
jgi:hypothetical protein